LKARRRIFQFHSIETPHRHLPNPFLRRRSTAATLPTRRAIGTLLTFRIHSYRAFRHRALAAISSDPILSDGCRVASTQHLPASDPIPSTDAFQHPHRQQLSRFTCAFQSHSFSTSSPRATRSRVRFFRFHSFSECVSALPAGDRGRAIKIFQSHSFSDAFHSVAKRATARETRLPIPFLLRMRFNRVFWQLVAAEVALPIPFLLHRGFQLGLSVV
jgi:hypothetical protein